LKVLWGFLIFMWWMICLAAAAVLAVPVIYQVQHADRIYEGVQVAGIELDGLTLDEAMQAIHDRFTPYPGAPVTIRHEAHTWSLSPADLGVSVDARATAAEAFAVGRRGATGGDLLAGLRADLEEQWHARNAEHPIDPVLRLDENRLAIVLKQIAREVDQPPREGALNFAEATITGTPGATGRVVDLDAMRAVLLELLSQGKGGLVPLTVEQRQPAVTSVDAAVAKANALLDRAITLTAEGADSTQRSAIDRAMLRSWLKLSAIPGKDGALDVAVEVNDARIRAYVQSLAKSFDKSSQEAALDYDTAAKQVIVLKASKVGQALDVKASTDAISKTLLSLAANPTGADQSALAGSVAITLPTKILQPKVDSTRIADLGIKELVTQGTTYFAGSAPERAQNIINAAQKFQGAVVAPGEQFSFNKIVGDVSAENGFVDSLIISGDRTELGIGGGVCQVSTTAFRAAVQGGFPITERHTHSYVVSWYGEPGLDATIFTPYVDFRFKNDTGAFLLVKPEVDKAKGRITFSYYGTRPNRTVELSKPETSNIQKPEPPIYQEDSSLPKGTLKQIDWAKDGMDVIVKRTITDASGKATEEKIISKYEPWRSVFAYGPGTQLPANALIGAPLPPKPTATPKPKS
jgi:vancomycin resistance protein YoaR